MPSTPLRELSHIPSAHLPSSCLRVFRTFKATHRSIRLAKSNLMSPFPLSTSCQKLSGDSEADMVAALTMSMGRADN